MEFKTCSKCQDTKSVSEFYKDAHLKSGKTAACKTCLLLSIKRYQATKRGRETKAAARAAHKRTPGGRLSKSLARRKRRDKQRDIDMKLLKADLIAIYNRFENKCFYCGLSDLLEIDHHYPLSRGHGLSHANAVVLCSRCNNMKSDMLPEQFYTSKELEMLRTLGVEHLKT